MLIELRLPPSGKGVDESISVMSSFVRAAAAGEELTGTKLVCDWVQYRNNFRFPVIVREVLDPAAKLKREIAVDLRRVDHELSDGRLASLLRDQNGEVVAESVPIEEWAPLSQSCIWRFNALYWQELALWERAAGHGYERALPGGRSAGTNEEGTRATITELFRIWDSLAERRCLPEQLTVLELGVGVGEQARTFLDQLERLDHEIGSSYYRRLNYLMGDYSPHVLERARANVSRHKARVSTLVLDAARPRETLRFLGGKVFFAYISNVYDNLPTDEIALLDGSFYLVEGRAVLPRRDRDAIAERLEVSPEEVTALARQLLRLGPRLLCEIMASIFPDETAVARFWLEVWQSLGLEERYVPLGPLDLYRVAEELQGDLVSDLLDGTGDLRFHVSNSAIESFVDTLPLLHPLGSLVSHDLFVTDLQQYRSGFRGPGKYDGSVVNWVNGPLLRAAAARLGFSLDFAPFGYGSNSSLVSATARARD